MVNRKEPSFSEIDISEKGIKFVAGNQNYVNNQELDLCNMSETCCLIDYL